MTDGDTTTYDYNINQGLIAFNISDINGLVGRNQVGVYLYENDTGNSLGYDYTSSDGKITFNVAPGVYKARLIYYPGNPQHLTEWEYDIVVTDGDTTTYDYNINQGLIAFNISDINGLVGRNQVGVYLYENDTGNSLGYDYTSSDGKITFNVAPGVYKARLIYYPGNPQHLTEWEYDIVVTDGDTTTYDYNRHVAKQHPHKNHTLHLTVPHPQFSRISGDNSTTHTISP